MITLSFWRSGGCDHAVKAMTLQTILHIGRCIFRKGECLRVALMMIVTRESVRRVIVCGWVAHEHNLSSAGSGLGGWAATFVLEYAPV